MNRNIKLLCMNAEVSTEYYPFKDIDDPRWKLHEQFVEKLVNLVVEESIEQIQKVSDRHSGPYIDAALRDAAFEISQHFRSIK